MSTDQVFTSLGFFFNFEVGTARAHAGENTWITGSGKEEIPSVIRAPKTSTVKPSFAHFTHSAASTSEVHHIALPGSGVLHLTQESGPQATGVVGVSRSLTPLSTGVDLTKFWGVSVMLKLKTTSPLAVQLQLESTSVHDYAFHKSSVIHVATQDCWMHVQLPFSAFHASSGLPLDLTTIAKLTLVAPVLGREGERSQLEIAGFAILAQPIANEMRVAAAPCTSIGEETSAPSHSQPQHGSIASEMRSISLGNGAMDALVDLGLKKAAASTSSASSLILLSAAAFAALVRWL
jgi:hypothetical protein